MYYDEYCGWPMLLMLGYHSTGQVHQNHTAVGSWCVTCHQVLDAHVQYGIGLWVLNGSWCWFDAEVS